MPTELSEQMMTEEKRQGAWIADDSRAPDFAIETESELLYFRKQYGWAGLVADVLLATLADTAFALKALVSHPDKERSFRLVQQIKIGVATPFRTRLRSRPT